MTAVGKYNPNSIIKGYVRGLGLNETSNTDRHIMLADIRAALGSEKFSEWYNEVYKLRSAGKHAEYEQAIKAMFGELPASHPAPEDVRTEAERDLDQWQEETRQTRESDRPL